ncbi:MAG TPA: hypothetical protein VGR10_06095 [Thermoleophilaceae bacterium]|nr:hypothetical protein [Thermoleophilaceae bacterium]
MAGHGNRVRTRAVSRDELDRRTARRVGFAGFVAAALLPVLLWHRAIAIVASEFRLDPGYLLTGWTGYALIGAGLLFAVPVVLSIGRRPESRFYPRSRGAYAGWGAVLYTLGMLLASQVAQIAETPA